MAKILNQKIINKFGIVKSLSIKSLANEIKISSNLMMKESGNFFWGGGDREGRGHFAYC